MKAARLVIDLDGTLCTAVDGKYDSALPIVANIDKVNQLRAEGHYIHIFTARGMATFNGVALLAKLRWRTLTVRQLKRWGVRYDKISLGKPSADLYVDDKAMFAEEFFKELDSKSVDELSPN